MGARSVCCLSRCEFVPFAACLDASSFHATLPHLPCPFVTRSREKTCVISHDIYRLHVEEAQQAWHRAELHVEGAETSRQSDQLGNVIPHNTRSREKTHAITHDIYRLHVEAAVWRARCRAQLRAQRSFVWREHLGPRRLSGQRGLESLDVLFGGSPRSAEARQEATIRQGLPNTVLHLARETLVSGLI